MDTRETTSASTASSSASSSSSSTPPTGDYKFQVFVHGQHDELPKNIIAVNATSRSKEPWSVALSPFFLGPCDLYNKKTALNLENAWQYAKVYPSQAKTPQTDASLPPEKQPPPGDAYFAWAETGWKNSKPQRFPMGRGAIPMYSYWDGRQLGYIEARHQIYCKLYAALVEKTDAYQRLKNLYEKAKKEGKVLTIFDFDGHNSLEQFNGDYEKIFYNHKMKMGHGFVLAMMLTNNRIWEKPFDATKIHHTKVPRRVSAESQIPSEITLFVSGIPTNVTKQTVEGWFAKWKGSVILATNKDGSSKGFAFAEFASHQQQLAALTSAVADIAAAGVTGVEVKPAYQNQEKRSAPDNNDAVDDDDDD